MEWTEDAINRLRVLWAEGHSTAEIGRRMGISKNAVVGKAHRLELTARPSPIRREGQSPRPPRRAAARRVSGPTLPSLAGASPPGQSSVRTEAAAEPGPAVAVPAPERERTVEAEPPAVQAAPEQSQPVAETRPAVRPVTVTPPAYRSSRQVPCCWPIGEPGTSGFRFCDGDALMGKPYCRDHAALAYVKVRDRRDEAA